MFLNLLKFLIPILLWLFLSKGLLTGASPILSEPFADLAILKFYLSHLRMGVIPLWNPFLYWGFPWQILLNFFGFANPIWILTLGLAAAGVKIYFAFVWTVVVYFLIGQIGFYFLAKEFLKDRQAAYVAFLLLLFSSIGLVSMAQLNMLFIFVPAVWFFYFLVRFFWRWDVTSWIGMIFTLMLIAQAYLPFYFMTVLLLVGLIFGMLNFLHLKRMLFGFFNFCKGRSIFVFLTIIVLGISLAPSYLSYRSTVMREVVIPWRHESADVLDKGASFSAYDKTAEGGLSSRMSVEDLYSNFDRLLYANDGFFYVSGFAFLILFLGAFNRVNRKIISLVFLLVTILVISIASATPVQQFLFEHIFYFKLMRNMHFFLPFLLAVFVLLTAEQARILLHRLEYFTIRQRWLAFIIVSLVHAGCWVFLSGKENVSLATYGVVVLSFIFCLGGISQISIWTRYGQPLFLAGCIIFQPVMVIAGHNQLAVENFSGTFQKVLTAVLSKPQFSYVRGQATDFSHEASREQQIYHFYSDYFSMEDFLPTSYAWQQCATTFWSYYLFKGFPSDIVNEYARNKFVVYDSVQLIVKEIGNHAPIVEALQSKANTAFVAMDRDNIKDELASLLKKNLFLGRLQFQAVSGASSVLKVHYFDANTIRFTTDFNEEKFLVYNDNYAPGWKAYLNGRSIPIYRANVAFKGIKLPAGRNEVRFIYSPSIIQWVMPGLFILYGIIALLLFCSVLREFGGKYKQKAGA